MLFIIYSRIKLLHDGQISKSSKVNFLHSLSEDLQVSPCAPQRLNKHRISSTDQLKIVFEGNANINLYPVQLNSMWVIPSYHTKLLVNQCINLSSDRKMAQTVLLRCSNDKHFFCSLNIRLFSRYPYYVSPIEDAPSQHTFQQTNKNLKDRTSTFAK